jgi:hypothetical protein
MVGTLRRSIIAGSILVGGLYGTAAQADPIAVTSGSAFLFWDAGPTSISLSGTNFLIFGDGTGGGLFGWQAGTLGNLDGSFAFSPFRTPFGVVVDGTTQTAFLDGGVSFTTVPFIVPTADGPDPTVFRTTFTMAGRVRGYSSAERTGAPLFDLDLVGRGSASVEAFPVPDAPFYLSHTGISYEFAPLSQTPEPGTIVLLGLGVLGIAATVMRGVSSC